MKIIVDAIPMIGLLTGIARYLRNLYGTMSLMNQVDLSYFEGKSLMKNMPPLAESDKWQRSTNAVWMLPDQAVFALRSAHWLKYEHNLRRTCRKNQFDLYHETAFVPAKLRSVPSVYSIYDLSLRRFRETHPRERVWFFEYFFKRRMSYASHILTLSEFIRQEIIEELHVPSHMVTAIPLAQDPLFGPRPVDKIRIVQKKRNLPDEYLLFVGSLEPRKNIDRLIEALRILKIRIPLVLTGWQGWGEKEWLGRVEQAGLAGQVYLTGHIPDEELACLYSGATALVYPSLYEGFGLPILEAMAGGCPVICSNTASMPEVAGNAAVLIDSHNTEEMASAIGTVVQNSAKRKELIAKGYEQASKFSWEKTAMETLRVFKRMVKKK